MSIDGALKSRGDLAAVALRGAIREWLKLPPGTRMAAAHALRREPDEPNVGAYWQDDFSPFPASVRDAIADLLDALEA